MIISTEVSGQFTQVYLDQDASNEVINTSFYSATEGYVAFKRWIGFTTDGGKSFQKKTVGTNNVDLGLQSVSLPWATKGVKAFDSNNLLVYGDWDGVPSILSSADGGNTFKMVLYSRINLLHFNNGITDIVFPQNGSIGYAVDEDRIFKTVNRGQNWSLMFTSAGSEFHSLAVGSNNEVFVYSGKKMMKTTNAGLAWTQVQLPAGEISAADFITPLKGWLTMTLNRTSNTYYTSDGGTTWQQKSLQNLWFRKLKFTDDQTGYGVAGLQIFKTTDSGRIWEPFAHQSPGLERGGTYNTMGNFGANHFWAGTSEGLLESATNAGGITIPAAIYTIDTTGVSNSNNVKLVNLSKQGYEYKWLLNGQLISTAYHAQYSPTPMKYIDTIQLVVSNGTYTSDTATQLVNFSTVIIESFSPMMATDGETVVIKGRNFWGVNFVSFGGTRASFFRHISDTEIHAVVFGGSTGSIYINTSEGSAYKPGFVYNSPPITNLDFIISDTILCKSESIQIRLQNSEPGVEYALVDENLQRLGSVRGNGEEAVLRSIPISETGVYSILIRKDGIGRTTYLDKTVSVRVEKTRSVIGADRVNITAGEAINFVQQSKDALNYNWTFHDGASIQSHNGPTPGAITYNTTGDKSATLISVSADGCRDTTSLKVVTVYDETLLDDECFAQTVHGIDTYEFTGLHRAQPSPDGGYVLTGWGNTLKLPSRAGSPKLLPATDMAFVAKYTAAGVILWQCNVGRNGSISGATVDEQGNVYVIGTLRIHDYFYFNNGDSMRIGHTGEQLVGFYERANAYILKLDRNGKYLWHTNLYNGLREGQGYSVNDIQPTIIRIQGNQLILAGTYKSDLNYFLNGVRQPLKSPGFDGGFRTFVIQLSTEGVFNWGMYWDVPGGHAFSDLNVDKAGNILIAGTFDSDVVLRDVGDKYVYTIPRVGGSKLGAYMMKFDNSGKFLWKARAGYEGPEIIDVAINSISIDESGNVYAVGAVPWYYVQGGFNVYLEDESRLQVDPGGSFLLKFNQSGRYLWGTGIKSEVTFNTAEASFIKGNALYFTYTASQHGAGRVAYKLNSNNGKSVIHSIGGSEFGLAKYTLDGNLERIYTSGESEGGFLKPVGIYIDADDKIVISGTIDPSNGGTGQYTAFGNTLIGNRWDGFLLKLKNDVCYTGETPTADAGPDHTSCSNEGVTIGSSTSTDPLVWTSSTDPGILFTPKPTVKPSITTTYYLYVTNNSGLTAIDSVNISVNSIPGIEAGESRSVCANTSVTIGLPAVDGVSYTWRSEPAGFVSTEASVVVQPSVTTTYILSASNGEGCSAKDTVTINVEDYLLMSVAIKGPEMACRGVENIYTADVVNGGADPMYKWTINGKPVGTNAAIFKTSDLKDNDKLEVWVVPTLTCASPQSGMGDFRYIRLTDPKVPRAIFLPLDTNVCLNQTVAILVGEVGDVRDVSFDWRRNGISVAIQDPIYELRDPKDGDQIFVIVSASDGCGRRSADTTKVVTLKVGSLRPQVSIMGNSTVVKGQSTTIIASATDAGNAPSVSWEDSTSSHGWAAINGAVTNVLTYAPAKTGDRVRCVITASDECSGQVRKASAPITFNVSAVTAVDPDPIAIYGVNIFPNPATDVLYLRNLNLTDQWQRLSVIGMDGKRVVAEKDIRGMDRLELPVTNIPSGVYTLVLTGKAGKRAYYKVILHR